MAFWGTFICDYVTSSVKLHNPNCVISPCLCAMVPLRPKARSAARGTAVFFRKAPSPRGGREELLFVFDLFLSLGCLLWAMLGERPQGELALWSAPCILVSLVRALPTHLHRKEK